MFKKSAIFLDRDGVLIWSFCKYLRNPRQVTIIEGMINTLVHYSKLGFKIIVVTNQPGIGRKHLTHEDVDSVNSFIKKKVCIAGGDIDGFYVCPHIRKDMCDCRKPKVGLFLQAASELDVDLKSSFFVGDRMSDIKAANVLGMRSILCLTGWGSICFFNPTRFINKPWKIILSIASLPRAVEL